MRIDHHLELSNDGVVSCRICGTELASGGGNFKDGAIMKVRSIQSANPLIVPPETFIDPEVVFRQFYCPGCATLLENEVVLASSAVIWDKQIDRSPTDLSSEDRMP